MAGELDSALWYGRNAYELDLRMHGKNERQYIPIIIGNIFLKMKNYSSALDYYRIAQSNPTFIETHKDRIEVYNGMASVFKKIGNRDSGIYYAQRALDLKKFTSYPLGTLNTYRILSDIYNDHGILDSTVHYLELTIALRDSLFSQQKQKEVHRDF